MSRLCLLAALVAQAATFLCTPWIPSRPDNKATLTGHQNTAVWAMHISRFSGRRALGEDCMEVLRRPCWDHFQAPLFSSDATSPAKELCSTVVLVHRSRIWHLVCNLVPGLIETLLTYAGFLADFVASVIYVPSEVLKTRLQLQGRYKNPYFISGYNYRSTWDAARTIARVEGVPALYSGYKATIIRDLPFSAFQFALYEQFRRVAVQSTGSHDLGFGWEVTTAVSAGGIAGAVTCPLDVVKTRIQTQIMPDSHEQSSLPAKLEKVVSVVREQKRHIHSGPRTVPTTVPTLDTSSILTGLKMIYKTEGVGGWFRGVGPRTVWTSVQSGTMLVMYQYLLKQFERMSEKKESSSVI